MNERRELLEQISAIEFVIADLKLFLDTHPCDADALKLYKDQVQKVKDLREKYVAFYGPLMAECYEPDKTWAWIDDPWPWNKQ